MKLQKTTLIGLLILILLISIIIGHFLPPAGILATPVVISVMTGLIVFTNVDFNIFAKLFLSYLFIGLNDIGTKLYAGGIHDMEGIGWIHTLLFIGLIPCFIMILIGVYQDKMSVAWVKIVSVLTFILLIYIHLEVFETLGVHVL
ncbi:hypothetical protein [Pedobacter sp. L105]|uniref:hypothetical protein n=1 Tax=Pedobacter sp. L105 TaxID=1641871 RepID=UPI00131B3715|nr:hypothetical protein [Pedobacter sp. L105]